MFSLARRTGSRGIIANYSLLKEREREREREKEREEPSMNLPCSDRPHVQHQACTVCDDLSVSRVSILIAR